MLKQFVRNNFSERVDGDDYVSTVIWYTILLSIILIVTPRVMMSPST